MIVLWRVKMLRVFRRSFSSSRSEVRMASTRSELRSVSPACRDSSLAAAWARLRTETSGRLRLLPEMSRWRSFRSGAWGDGASQTGLGSWCRYASFPIP